MDIDVFFFIKKKPFLFFFLLYPATYSHWLRDQQTQHIKLIMSVTKFIILFELLRVWKTYYL